MHTLLIFGIAGFVFIGKAGAQNETMYCATMKDGIIEMTADDKEIQQAVTLANGAVIHPDGNVVRKDGTTVSLDDNECVDAEGNKIAPGRKSRIEKEEEKVPPLYK